MGQCASGNPAYPAKVWIYGAGEQQVNGTYRLKKVTQQGPVWKNRYGFRLSKEMVMNAEGPGTKFKWIIGQKPLAFYGIQTQGSAAVPPPKGWKTYKCAVEPSPVLAFTKAQADRVRALRFRKDIIEKAYINRMISRKESASSTRSGRKKEKKMMMTRRRKSLSNPKPEAQVRSAAAPSPAHHSTAAQFETAPARQGIGMINQFTSTRSNVKSRDGKPKILSSQNFAASPRSKSRPPRVNFALSPMRTR